MSSSRMLQRVVPVTLVALAVVASAQAQERRVVVKAPSRECGPGSVVVGSLGYSGIECSNCSFTLHADGSDRQWKFRSEPVITGAKPGGPADGNLKTGDVIVAIGGYLITTQEGGRLFGSVTPGEAVTLRIRRDGREGQVEITPSA
ncbi:MAG: PDZ domain-containing protein, partial [Gemmatimonadales bacterium]|nr:PDZ domain-containing protein [Gemmatimonadales bacterium]